MVNPFFLPHYERFGNKEITKTRTLGVPAFVVVMVAHHLAALMRPE
jgi:hypothetical protein